MCNARRFRRAAGLMMLGLVTATQLSAQQTSSERIAQLRTRLDSLTAAAIEATHAARSRDSLELAAKLAKNVERLDTTHVGPFRVVTLEGESKAEVSLITDAWEARRAWLGPIEPRLRGAVILVEGSKPVALFKVLRTAPRHHLVAFRLYRLGANREWMAGNVIGSVVQAELPAEVKDWLGGTAVGGSTVAENVFREMAVSRSSATQDCRAGKKQRCADALGLTGPGTQWSNWYTSDDLRQILMREAVGSRRRREVIRERVDRQMQHPCFAQRSDAACFEVFEQRSLPAPLSGAARASFIDYLLQTNPGGMAILIADAPRPVAERLTAMAGGDLAGALAKWRTSILKARPEQVAASFSTSLTTLIWFAVFAGLAMRSTRWRTR